MKRNQPRETSIGIAKARFAECVREAESGGSIVLTRHGRPVARIEPFEVAIDPGAPRGRQSVAESSTGASVREEDVTYEARDPERSGAISAPAASPQAQEARRTAILRVLEEEIWPAIPKALMGRGVSKRQRETILGYGKQGV